MSTSGREAGSAPLGMKAMLYLETTQRQMARKGTFSKAPVPDRFTRRVEMDVRLSLSARWSRRHHHL